MSDAAADFAADSVVSSLGGGRFTAQSPAAWFGPAAPNGGFLTALLVRAMSAELDAPDRQPRSLTVHFSRPPGPAPLDLSVAIERAGRTASTVTGRIEQGGKLMALALGTWTQRYDDEPRWEHGAPSVPPPSEIEPIVPRSDTPPMFHQLDARPVFGGPPFEGAEEALTGGWIRTRVPQPADYALLALYSDAWYPSAFARLTTPLPAPTLDLTLHFRSPPPAGEHPFVLCRYRSRAALDGLFEEDGELWSEDGRLLVQSRQLALLTGAPRRDAEGGVN